MSVKDAFNAMDVAREVIAKLRHKSDNYFILTWDGSKIPRGAKVDNVEISWTQNGMVTGKGGEQLGYYDRLVEFGQPGGNRQVMLIGTSAKTITPPPGGLVEAVMTAAPSNQCPFPTAEAEKALAGWNVPFTKQADGTLLVNGDLDLGYKGLTDLPDLRCVAVAGNFICRQNKIPSLKNAPQRVDGHYDCSFNALTDLTGAPRKLSGEFHCNENQLTTLKGGPIAVTKFYCQDNQLTTLVYAPRSFTRLTTDFGSYDRWEFVPKEYRPDISQDIEDGLPLREAMKPTGAPVAFKKKEPPKPPVPFKKKDPPQNP